MNSPNRTQSELVEAWEIDDFKFDYEGDFINSRKAFDLFRRICEQAKAALALAADQKDAERYRWLNAQDNFMAYIEHPDGTKTYRLKCGDVLDSWIDAALAARRGEGA